MLQELMDNRLVRNEDALKYGARLLSCYRTARGDRLYIITEAGREVTTILLPEEY